MNASCKPLRNLGLFPFLALSLAGSLPGAEADDAEVERKLDPRLQTYFAAKEQHARSLAKQLKVEVAPEIWSYFEAGRKGNWSTLLELWPDLRRRSGQYAGGSMDPLVRTPVWQTVLETDLAYEAFAQMDMKFVDAFARDVIDSIPRGSIYFGGTDPGRGVITAFCKSHPDGDPFFVLTQNALADGSYTDYLRAIYGKKIHMLSEKEAKQGFEDYLADAGRRLKEGKLKPGEEVKVVNGKTQVSGPVAVMALNGFLAKRIFDENPGREFYVEESFALDWMYPHLSPHGLILKVNRKPLKEMTEETVRKDREYWRQQTARLIGGWLTEETPIKAVCEFVERVYGQGDLEGFTGDPLYATADRRYNPQRMYGKLRSSQVGVYLWRAEHPATPTEKKRMTRAAEFASRQAVALCPEDTEAVRRLGNLLKELNRLEDARLVVETGLKISPGSKRLRQLEEELK